MTWVVSMFFFKGMYGFVHPLGRPGEALFFHAADFHRTEPGEPLPIIGELVDVIPEDPLPEDKPRALEVRRRNAPERFFGKVTSYNPEKGWGFVEYGRDKKAFLHASEVRNWLPHAGAGISFYLGNKNDKPRACWVQPG